MQYRRMISSRRKEELLVNRNEAQAEPSMKTESMSLSLGTVELRIMDSLVA